MPTQFLLLASFSYSLALFGGSCSFSKSSTRKSSICFSKKLLFREANHVCLGELLKMRLSAREGARAAWPSGPQGRELQPATSLGRAA